MKRFSEQNQINAAVIFDMDGVLIDSMRIQWESWGAPAQKRGLSVPSPKEVIKRSGYKPCAFIEDFWLHENLSRSDIDIFAKEKEENLERLLFHDFPEMPGAIWLIKSLRESGFDIAIGSSSLRISVESVVKEMKIGGYLKCIVSGDEVTNSKPAPDIFLLAANRLGRNSHECLVIEDAEAGVLAAKRAGMKCIAFRSWGHDDDKYKGEYEGKDGQRVKYEADYIVDGLDEETLRKVHELLGVPQRRVPL